MLSDWNFLVSVFLLALFNQISLFVIHSVETLWLHAADLHLTNYWPTDCTCDDSPGALTEWGILLKAPGVWKQVFNIWKPFYSFCPDFISRSLLTCRLLGSNTKIPRFALHSEIWGETTKRFKNSWDQLSFRTSWLQRDSKSKIKRSWRENRLEFLVSFEIGVSFVCPNRRRKVSWTRSPEHVCIRAAFRLSQLLAMLLFVANKRGLQKRFSGQVLANQVRWKLTSETIVIKGK